MTTKTLNKYLDKINQKRYELIEAQTANDKPWADSVRQEIDLLMSLCFYDDEGNLLYLN